MQSFNLDFWFQKQLVGSLSSYRGLSLGGYVHARFADAIGVEDWCGGEAGEEVSTTSSDRTNLSNSLNSDWL